jgi:Fe-S-cluster containining protein
MTGMVAFECTWCGKCCACYGDFIKIERQLTSRDYYCRYGIKNEMFLAHVEGDYIGSYPSEPKEGKQVKGCPFMQKNQSGDGFACAIYATRPQVCKEFRCYRMIILDRDGHECGRIMGRNQLKTIDETLEHIWDEEIAPLPYREGTRWVKLVIDALAVYGYRGEVVE